MAKLSSSQRQAADGRVDRELQRVDSGLQAVARGVEQAAAPVVEHEHDRDHRVTEETEAEGRAATATDATAAAAEDGHGLFEAEASRPDLVLELQNAAAAARHAGERIFGDDHRQAGLFHE